MKLVLELPDSLPDILHISKEQFLEEAKLAMFLKLYELKRVSSGVAARVLKISRIEFLFILKKYKIPIIDIEEEELLQDIANA